jgi:hypothetical protein
MNAIIKRMDDKLVKEPMQNFIKQKAKELKKLNPADVKLGKDMRQELRKATSEWIQKNQNFSSTDLKSAQDYLADKDIRSFIREKSELSYSKAANIFAGDDTLKNNYLKHLKENEARNAIKNEGFFTNAYKFLSRDKTYDPKSTAESFIRKVDKIENNKPWYSSLNPFNRIDLLDRKIFNKDKISAMNDAAQRRALKDRLSQDLSGLSGKKLEKENKKREIFRDQLRDLAIKNGKADSLFEKTAIKAADLHSKQGGDLKDLHAKEIKEEVANLSTKDALEGRKIFGNIADSEIVNKSNEALTKLKNGVDDAISKNSTFVPQNFEVQFGASITAALLQQSDIGLKGSINNIVLGVPDIKDGEKLDPTVKNMLKINQNQVDAKIKMTELEIKLKEHELTKITDENLKLKLEKEIKDLKSEAKDYEREYTKIDNIIKN